MHTRTRCVSSTMVSHSTQSAFALAAPDALWRYACTYYADPDIATACLDLQERAGADVCELLWLGWLDHLGLTPDANVADVLVPVREHQARQTYRLRAKRRALKPLARTGSPLAEWRERLKRAELRAEREALDRLQALTQRGEGVCNKHASDADLYTVLVRHLGPTVATLDHSLTMLAQGLRPRASLVNLSHHDPSGE
ncbi:MAG TPA: TIGR02444 family protein [Modicisalibacter sp.]|nr:TIGR02444 family protein [Modicisalibacter sp.]